MKKILSLLLTVLLIFGVAPANLFAIDVNADTSEYYTYTVSNGEATITGCDTSISGDIVIPSTLEDYPVTSIFENAFSSCSSLTSITIPDSVKHIGYYAFRDCSGLNNIVFGNGLEIIDDYAFLYCTSLVSAIIPDGVKIIGESAFKNCTNLSEIVVPDSVLEMRGNAFRDTAYYNNSSNWEDDVLYIGKHLLSAKEDIAELYTVKEGTKTISGWAFSYCSKLTGITIPDSVKYIGYHAFENCSGLNNIVFGNSLEIIDVSAFYNCTSLISVIIPDSVKRIGESAFSYCTNLSEIVVPDSVLEIGAYAFGDTAYYNNSSNWENNVLYIGKHLLEAKENIVEPYTVKEGTKTISESAFSYCYTLKGITIPESVISIGDRAFYKCSILATANIPSGVTSIGRETFYDCNELTSITIPDGVTSIGDYAFASCENLADVTIPDSVTSIGEFAFSGCINFTQSITIPESVKSLGDGAFNACTRMAGITILGDITSIGPSTFSNCYGFTNITLPDSVKSIGENAFYYCDMLSSITLPSGLISIGDNAFKNCTRMTDITIPDSVTSIGVHAFYGCTKLTNITIFDGIEQIGAYAFGDTAYYNDSSNWEDNVLYLGNNLIGTNRTLSDLYAVRSGTKLIADSSFGSCANLTGIIIPNSVKRIGDAAFSYCRNIKNVYYCGTEEEWNEIYIGEDNTYLTRYSRNYHDFGEWIIRNNANCSIEGEKYCICSICGEEKTEIIPTNDNHEYESAVTEPTCIEQGYTAYTCNYCGDTYCDDYISAKGHSFGEWITRTEANCNFNGEKYHVCSICGEEETDIIPINGNHKYNSVVTEPNCIEKGYTTYTCEYCQDTYIDNYVEASKQNHKYENGVCILCQSFIESKHDYSENTDETYVISKENTASITITFSAETFFEDGWDFIYIYDGNDNEVGKYTGSQLASKSVTVEGNTAKIRLITDRVNNAYGFKVTDLDFNCAHDYTAETKKATCTEDGYTKNTCKYCQDIYYSDEVSAYGHNYTERVAEPTCTEQGYTEFVCENCGDNYRDNYTNATGVHIYENGNCIYCEEYLESEHDYTNLFDKTWEILRNGAKCITITFSAETFVEEDWDFIYIYDGNGNEVGKYTGSQLASKSVTVASNTAKIRLVTDRIGTAYGFKISDISVEYNGDLNGDSILNSEDLILIKNALLSKECSVEFDINGDGYSNIKDIVRLKKIIAGYYN